MFLISNDEKLLTSRNVFEKFTTIQKIFSQFNKSFVHQFCFVNKRFEFWSPNLVSQSSDIAVTQGKKRHPNINARIN